MILKRNTYSYDDSSKILSQIPEDISIIYQERGGGGGGGGMFPSEKKNYDLVFIIDSIQRNLRFLLGDSPLLSDSNSHQDSIYYAISQIMHDDKSGNYTISFEGNSFSIRAIEILKQTDHIEVDIAYDDAKEGYSLFADFQIL